MSAAHDPIADPLTPYWRAKVTAASSPGALRSPRPCVWRTGGLTPRQRHYVNLVEVEGLSPAAAAQAEGVDRNNIYRALSAARAARGSGA